MLASSGHQVAIATCSTCHATQSWLLVKEDLGGCSHIAGSSFSSSPLKNSSTLGSSIGGPLRPPSLGCDQSAVFWSCRWRKGVIHLCGLWPVYCLGGCCSIRIQTGILKSNLSSGSHGAGWRHPPLSSISRVACWSGGYPHYDSSYIFYFLSALYFLTNGDCLIGPSYCATCKRQSSSATLYVLLAWLPQLVPGSEHPWLPLGLPPGTPVVCLKSDQSGHRLPVSGHGICLSRSPSDSVACRPSPHSSGWAGPHLHWRHGFSISNISMQVSSAISLEQVTSPGFLFNWYNWWYKAMISSHVDSCVNSSMVGTSA